MLLQFWPRILDQCNLCWHYSACSWVTSKRVDVPKSGKLHRIVCVLSSEIHSISIRHCRFEIIVCFFQYEKRTYCIDICLEGPFTVSISTHSKFSMSVILLVWTWLLWHHWDWRELPVRCQNINGAKANAIEAMAPTFVHLRLIC